jgi:hypothetical protein
MFKHRILDSADISISLALLLGLALAVFRIYSDNDQRINIGFPSDWIINSPSTVGCNLCIVIFDSPVANYKGKQVAEPRVGIDSSNPARDLQSYMNNVIQ